MSHVVVRAKVSGPADRSSSAFRQHRGLLVSCSSSHSSLCTLSTATPAPYSVRGVTMAPLTHPTSHISITVAGVAETCFDCNVNTATLGAKVYVSSKESGRASLTGDLLIGRFIQSVSPKAGTILLDPTRNAAYKHKYEELPKIPICRIRVPAPPSATAACMNTTIHSQPARSAPASTRRVLLDQVENAQNSIKKRQRVI